jgi:hypothetical protein
MMYPVIYTANLLLALAMCVMTYWLANNEIRPVRRFLLAFLAASCTIECAILGFYVPLWYPDYSAEMMTTLLFAKLILKPALVAMVIYNVLDMLEKMRRSIPHGQIVAHVVPQPLETLEHNQVAAAKGKLDQAAEVAQHLNDSKVIERRKGKA